MKIKATKRGLFTAILLSALCSTQVMSAIALDRTRVIFNGSQKSVSLTVTNKNKQLPYLAQGWIENLAGEKINSPFTVLPPVQRLEPGKASQVRIEALPAIAQLPQDRESVFYFNLREIPPAPEKANVLQLALQTKIKLYYRPKALEISPTEKMNNPWEEKLVLLKQGNQVIAKNPTAYYTTIIGVGSSKDNFVKSFDAVMIAPFSEAPLGVSPSVLGNSPILIYVNDYGGRPELHYQCSGNQCTVKSEK